VRIVTTTDSDQATAHGCGHQADGDSGEDEAASVGASYLDRLGLFLAAQWLEEKRRFANFS